MTTPLRIVPRLPGHDTYRPCGECRDYWTRRWHVITEHLSDTVSLFAFDRIHAYRTAVHARHLAGLSIDWRTPHLEPATATTTELVATGEVVVCCGSHVPAPGDCCDPEDCGPCCPDCPTCPVLNRRGRIPQRALRARA